MAHILVLGGTRYFGRRLVEDLLTRGHDVTVASRGLTPDTFGQRVSRLRVDRADASSMATALSGRTYDVVYDQIGYTPRDAKGLLDALGDRVARIVFCSTGSVYGAKDDLITEADFDPAGYPVDLTAPEYDYGEGKRQAEAYLMQHAPCPVVLARPSYVVSGTDDYTGRFAFHVQHVLEGTSVGVLEREYPVSFITAWDAARALAFAGLEMTEAGPLNVVNPGYFTAGALTRRIAEILGRDAPIHVAGEDDPELSPYASNEGHRVAVDRAARLGFAFPPFEPELPAMVAAVVEGLSS